MELLIWGPSKVKGPGEELGAGFQFPLSLSCISPGHLQRLICAHLNPHPQYFI